MNPSNIGLEVWLLSQDHLSLLEWGPRDPRTLAFQAKWRDITRAIDLLAHSQAAPDPSVRGFLEVGEPTEERVGWEVPFE